MPNPNVQHFVRTPYNYDRNDASVESGLNASEGSRTKQEFKEECDINVLCKRFGLGYEMPTNFRVPTYADFSDVVDFHTAANAIALAGEAFDSLPAHLRDRFANNPGRFVDFCSDSRNRDELIALGLLQPAQELARDAVGSSGVSQAGGSSQAVSEPLKEALTQAPESKGKK